MRRQLKPVFDKVVSATVNSAVRAYHHQYLYSAKWHPHYALLRRALDDTVDYIEANMAHALVKNDVYGVLSEASRRVTIDGLFLEFGVRSGKTINHIARANPARTVYGFDSFEGLPEPWSGWSFGRGAFGGEGVPRVRDNVQLVVGWFDDTLPGFVESTEGDLAFAHVDSDLYSSATTVLDNLAPRVKPGTVIVFNEYFNYPNWREHEFKAWQEFCAAHDVEYEYLCWGMYEVAVQVTSIGKPATE